MVMMTAQCKTKQEAVKVFLQHIQQKTVITQRDINEAKKWNITLPKQKLRKFYDKHQRELQELVEVAKQRLLSVQQRLEEYQQQLKQVS